MLDQETKRRIDSARDVLVGKVPDPKAQVEQITIALIYKFMDDMDRESEELGGKPKFFTGDYKQYGWSKLLDLKVGGHERVSLYSEAIVKMSQNPKLPQLFRDIFKGAFLPYRNPETLNLFLKEINGFIYDHSERLGDAFEYLLSVLSAQGDAGQFRTPRHIIDFIVSIVDPQKNETILDPACGTAGFLISAYKHILNKNKEKIPGDKLRPDEKARLMHHIVGYDISPDMVRLSLVNLYLHGFKDKEPKVYEYDTLSSEQRWDETFDIILANPPFMSPKGGIIPHKRFSFKAKRSEVLFVDYMAEHLNVNGRAGIIVPEGIIFKSENAFKQLRKMLVEECLYTVVSLPAGVFNPYSGVKTSILLLDKTLSKKTKSILFVKVENDGFDLGAQRKSIGGSDLSAALRIISENKQVLLDGKDNSITDKDEQYAHLVKKEKILENSDCNLSGEVYRNTLKCVSREWNILQLGEVVEILDSKRKPITKSDRKKGPYPYYGATGILDYVDGFLFNEKLVLLGEDGAKWQAGEKTAFIAEGKYWVNNHAHVLRVNKNKIIDTFLVELLNYMDLSGYVTGVTVPKLNQQKMKSIEFPLPPLDIQQQIVDELDGYQKIIDGAKQVVDNYKPKIKIDLSWEMVELGKVIKISSGKGLTKKNFVKGDYLVYGGNGISGNHNKYFLENPTVIIGRVGEYCGAVHITKPKSWVTDNALYVVKYLRDDIEMKYLYSILKKSNLNKYAKVGGQPSISQGTVYDLKIPLPSVEIQNSIISCIEKEQELINSSRELIKMYKQKIQERIKEVWGE